MSAFLLQFRNPKASLHTRLSDLIKHLQKKGERHCQEFYRALQINAEQLYDDLPSRKILSKLICKLTELSICSPVNYETSFHLFSSDYLDDYLFIPICGFDCIALVICWLLQAVQNSLIALKYESVPLKRLKFSV